jgi:hypothetical protein
MEDCKPVITPMQTSCKLSKDDDSKSTDQRQYRSMIDSLLYVIASRPDVMQAVGQHIVVSLLIVLRPCQHVVHALLEICYRLVYHKKNTNTNFMRKGLKI